MFLVLSNWSYFFFFCRDDFLLWLSFVVFSMLPVSYNVIIYFRNSWLSFLALVISSYKIKKLNTSHLQEEGEKLLLNRPLLDLSRQPCNLANEGSFFITDTYGSCWVLKGLKQWSWSTFRLPASQRLYDMLIFKPPLNIEQSCNNLLTVLILWLFEQHRFDQAKGQHAIK